MISSRTRPIVIVIAVSLLLVGLLAASASAAVTGSQITSPGDPTLLPLVVEPLGGSSPQTLTIAGTATTDDGNASDTVELGCFYKGSTAVAEHPVQNFKSETVKLTVHGDGSFTTADLTGSEAVALYRFTNEQPCTLRAVPVGTSVSADLTPFKGPRLGDSEVDYSGSDASHLYDDYLETTTLQGYWGWDSAGSCGPYGKVYDPSTFQQSAHYVSDCQASLFERNEAGTAASIVIDTHNAYTVQAVHNIYSKGPAAPGEPYLSLGAPSFNPATGDLSQTETEELVRCEAADGSAVDLVNPSSGQCVKFASTGVQLVRTVETGQSGLQARVTDRFQSTEGSRHGITLSYAEEQGESSVNPSYRFPGESGFSTHAENSSAPTGSSAPDTFYYQVNPAAAEPENGLQNPRGAVTLSAVPDSGKFVADNYFEYVYANRTVPASGSLEFIHVLSQSLTQSGAESLAGQAEQALAGPTLSIDSPVNGANVSVPSVTVSGTARANLGIGSLVVNGAGTAVNGDGTWSTTVPLVAGANTITATATDNAGKTATRTITVTYTPVGPPPPVHAHATQVGSVSAKNGKVTLTLACVGPAGSKCRVGVSLTTLEKLRGGRLLAIAAKSRTHTKKVTVAAATVTINAGSRLRITLKLNATGRKLLARFHRLPAHLTAVLTSTTPHHTVIAQNLTVRPAPKKHRKH